MTRHLAGMLIISIMAATQARAEVIAVREAEDTTVTCAVAWNKSKVHWASAGYIAPATWGRRVGDKLEFDLTLDVYSDNLKLGIRYAYFADWHQRDLGDQQPGPRVLNLLIDGVHSIPVSVPDTKGWNHFQVATVDIPPMQPGYHHFALDTPTENSDTNVDTFIVYREPVDLQQAGLLRSTRLIDADKGIVLCASDLVKLSEPKETTYATLNSLYEFMAEDFQTRKDQQIYFHLTDKTRWWNTKADVVLNRYGIYVLADGQKYDRTEWCWALADYFVRDSGVPAWFAHSSARVMGWTNWLPSLQNSATEHETRNVAALQEQAAAFLGSPDTTTTRAEVVQLAMQAKYGEDIFKKFYAKVAEKRAANPAAPAFNKFETIAILSEAAGEDTLPFFKRWTGFKDEGPVDPLALVLQSE